MKTKNSSKDGGKNVGKTKDRIYRNGAFSTLIGRSLSFGLVLLPLMGLTGNPGIAGHRFEQRAYAQSPNPNAYTAQEPDPPGPSDSSDPSDSSNEATASSAGPVRMARFKLVTGAVTYRADSGLEWSAATVNLPIRQGAQIYVPAGARAEVIFDDGSGMYLGGGALVTFRNLYSDADGEFTQLTLKGGLAAFRLKSKLSIYQVDTPLTSVKSVGPARLRIGVQDIVEVGVKEGSATVEGQQDKATIQAVGFVTVRDTTSPYRVTNLPPDDSWEQWVDRRTDPSNAGEMSRKNLPPNLYLVAPDLDTYGTWRTVPNYGAVWYPHVEGNWRPYSTGSWVWVEPFGWTWVARESWGWAPYHYGSWVHGEYGWGWVPGPAHQYWSPGAVTFFESDGSIAWAPLCPEEIHYPARFGIGFRGGDWSLFFSIGGCGVYYPHENHICEVRPWRREFLNRRFFLTDQHHDAAHFAFSANHNGGFVSGSWVPRNAGHGGGSFATAREFGSGRNYAPVGRTNLAIFQHGRVVGAPANGSPSAGPASVRPGLASLTPARAFTHTAPPAAVVARSTFRAPVTPQIARNVPVRPGTNRATQPGAVTHPGSPIQGRTQNPSLERPQPGSTEEAVIRARGAVGLPQRARTGDGRVVGPGTVAPAPPARNPGNTPRVEPQRNNPPANNNPRANQPTNNTPRNIPRVNDTPRVNPPTNNTPRNIPRVNDTPRSVAEKSATFLICPKE